MQAKWEIKFYELTAEELPASFVEYWNEYWRQYAYPGWEKHYGDMSIGNVDFEHICLWPGGKIEAWFKAANGGGHHFSWGDHLPPEHERQYLQRQMDLAKEEIRSNANATTNHVYRAR